MPNYAMICEAPPTPPPVIQQLPSDEEATAINLKTGKKYKPVALRTKPVLQELPEKFRIIRRITGDPLEHLPVLNPNPPKFSPCG